MYSPVVGHAQERGSDDVLAANLISQAPAELQSRTVRIYKPAKNATQSGHWNGRQWKMDWDILPRGHRWENPLMGWQSSADFMQGTHIFFKTKEDAIHFAEKQGAYACFWAQSQWLTGARLRLLCPGAHHSRLQSQELRGQLHALAQEAQDHPDQVNPKPGFGV